MFAFTVSLLVTLGLFTILPLFNAFVMAVVTVEAAVSTYFLLVASLSEEGESGRPEIL
jgi:hypothetical protein